MLELDVEIELKLSCMLLSCHVRVSERTYTLYFCQNIKELLAQRRRHVSSLDLANLAE